MTWNDDDFGWGADAYPIESLLIQVLSPEDLEQAFLVEYQIEQEQEGIWTEEEETEQAFAELNPYEGEEESETFEFEEIIEAYEEFIDKIEPIWGAMGADEHTKFMVEMENPLHPGYDTETGLSLEFDNCRYIFDCYFLEGNIIVVEKDLGEMFELMTGVSMVSSQTEFTPNIYSTNPPCYSLRFKEVKISTIRNRNFYYYKPTSTCEKDVYAMSSLYLLFFLQRKRRPGFFYKTTSEKEEEE